MSVHNLDQSVKFLGIGKSVPSNPIAQIQTAKLAIPLNCNSEKQKKILPVLYKKTQVKSRNSVFIDGSVDSPNSFQSFFPKINGHIHNGPTTGKRMEKYKAEAPSLAISASEKALSESKSDPSQIKHLVTVSCTGFFSPGIDVAIIESLKLPRDTNRTHIGFMGCHGLFNGWRASQAIALQHPNEKVLLCSVELCTIHFSYGWNPDQIVANALFSDGSSAVVLEKKSENKEHGWELISTGSFLFPNSKDAMTWQIGDNGFEMTLSAKVPDLIRIKLYKWITEWLKSKGLSIKDIKSWAVHPGGPRILDAVQESLNLSDKVMEPSRKVLSKHGNMSSATILFILDELKRNSYKTPCVAIGFGPGLTAEVAILR